MHAAIDAADAAGDVKVMVVSSALDGFFAVGADIKHLSKIAGGGLSLVPAADNRLATPDATFVYIGLSAGNLGASWLLTRLIGPAATSEICFTGRLVHAHEALALGLVDSVSKLRALLDDALMLAQAIGANFPGRIELSKRALQATWRRRHSSRRSSSRTGARRCSPGARICGKLRPQSRRSARLS